MAKLAWIRASLAMSLAVVSSGAILLGCNPIGAEARRIETGFVGMEVRSLRRCMGEAHFYEIRDDGSELWAYTAPLNEDVADIEIARVTGRGTAHARPRVEGGSPVERESYETTSDVKEGKVPPGSCVYLFNLREGVVDGYRSRGRSHQDMNADASCTVALTRCVPVVATAGAASPD
jgi:hypothetical protein